MFEAILSTSHQRCPSGITDGTPAIYKLSSSSRKYLHFCKQFQLISSIIFYADDTQLYFLHPRPSLPVRSSPPAYRQSSLGSTLMAIKVTLSSLVQRITFTKSTDHTHLLSSSFTGSQFFSVLNTKNYFSKLSVISHNQFSRTTSSSHALRAFCSASAVLRTSHFRLNTVDAEPSAVLHLIIYYHYTFVSLTLCHSHISHKLYVLHYYYSWILNVFNVVLVDLGCKVTLSCYHYYY